ncbi:MAG: DNA starvation/stationary phase protection protein Dps [Planctomycetia bacterium]
MGPNNRQSTAAGPTFPTSVGLPADVREKTIALLNPVMADLFDLYSQTKQAHWNVKGMYFAQLHELFDDAAAEVLPFVDEVAERVTAVGGYATGTARMASKASRLPEYPVEAVNGADHLKALVDGSRSWRTRYGRASTNRPASATPTPPTC